MINKKRAFIPFILLAVGFAVLALRLLYIQIWEHEPLTKKVDKISFREKSETPLRGTIFDRNGRVLAMSVRSYTFFADPKMSPGPDEIAQKLKTVNIALNSKSIDWNKKTSYLPLLDNLDAKTVEKIKALEIKGTNFNPEYIRKYPEGRMACQLLGVVGLDGEGLSGVEFEYNKELVGDKQSYSFLRDGLGREITEKFVDASQMKGADIYLTIDRNLQYIAEKALEKAQKKLNPKKAVAIIQDPGTGEILAMASLPNFDPSDFSKSRGLLKNIAIGDIYEPGSTFKIVAMTGALEEKVARPQDKIYCENGSFEVYDHEIEDHEKEGMLTVQQVMEKSSNIGMAKLGQKLGKERLFQYIRQFGFGTKTGIDLPGEARGLIRPPEKWSGLSNYILSFGQEIGVTPLQLTNAYSALANGGTLLEPKLIKSVKTRKEKKDNIEVRQIRRVASAEVVDQLKKMLVGVVEKGTGVYAKISGYVIGGKTGTAQKKDPVTGQYSTSAHVASFCGIVPMSNPRFTILVVLDEPKGDYWGASTAAPVFKEIALQSLRYLKIPPDRGFSKGRA